MQPVSQSRMQSSQLWKPQPDSGGRSPPLDAWNSVRPLMAILVQPAPARNFGSCNNGRAGTADGRQPFLPVLWPLLGTV